MSADCDPSRLLARAVVDGTDDRVRVDRWAASHLVSVPSKKSAYKAAKAGRLRLDGRTVSPDVRVHPGQVVTHYAADAAIPVLNIPVPIAWEDEHLAVVVKPAGLTVSGNRSRTLQRALPANLAPSAEPDRLARPRPVHRLDAATSGVLLCAKTASALMILSRQFQQRRVRKRYRAIVEGRLEGEEGHVDDPIGGREALTRYRALRYTESLHCSWLTTLDLFPLTGRTHQLRRHMAGLGHHILGDRLYAPAGRTFRGKGLFLQAVALAFAHPVSGDVVDVSVPEAPKFESHRRREQRRVDATRQRGMAPGRCCADPSDAR